MPWMFADAMRPGGSDFIAFWSASRMVLEGQAAKIYNPNALGEIQLRVAYADIVPFVHPPQFLLVIWPLGFLNYAAAWLSWTAATYALWLITTRRLFPTLGWPIAAFPGALVALWHAQTGFLTSAIQAVIAWQFRRGPFRAGLCVGLLVIKPHLAVLIPFALLASRSWAAIGGAVLSIAVTAMASLVLFGESSWLTYPSSWAVSQYLLETGSDAFFLRQVTIYAMFRAWGWPEIAVIAQSFVTLTSIFVIWKVWACDGPTDGKVALLFALTPLATPYLFSYDLPFLVIPVAWLIQQFQHQWSKPILVAMYFAPLACRAIALPVGVNPTSLFCIGMAVCIYNVLKESRTSG
ncbi:glycosyltransferase family 87 protein [Novosphingobium ginsenosidimutans]|nr:glycosyltransferase family 87 protein [Novosphingobium ginsenosidimutans]